ncbi:putative ankyrin-repeat protein [Branchiostoma belcheri]|nr:putative ankyrin-repeat protein [Branchiostoma belcheri]
MPQGKTPLLPLIRDLANNISQQDLKKMKLGCTNHLSRKALNGIKTSRELFKTLNNVTFLKRVLKDAGKGDLVSYVEKYEEGRETLLPRDKVVELKVTGYEPITVQLAHPTSHLSTGTMEMVRGTLGNLLATATPTADVFYRSWAAVERRVEITFMVPNALARQLEAEAANRRDCLALTGIMAVQRENCADTTLLLPPITAPPRAASVEVPHRLYPLLDQPEALQRLNLITPDQSQDRTPLILPSIRINTGAYPPITGQYHSHSHQSQDRTPLILPSIRINTGAYPPITGQYHSLLTNHRTGRPSSSPASASTQVHITHTPTNLSVVRLVADDKKDSYLAACARVRSLTRQLVLVRTQKNLSGEEEQRLMALLQDAEQEEQGWKQDYEAFLSTLETSAEEHAKVETQALAKTEPQKPKVEKQKVEQRSVSPDLGHTLAEGIIQAAKEGDLQLVRLLLTSGCDLGSKDGKGHLGVVQELLKAGADVFSTDHAQRKTALHVAADQGHAGIVDALIKKGASVNMRDKEGHLPLHLAAIAGRDVAVETLAKACSRSLLNDSDMSGFTALHHASDRGFAAVVENLLKAGANVNAKDLRAGANVNAKDLRVSNSHINTNNNTTYSTVTTVNLREFRTPLDLAEEKNHTKVVILLYNAGGGYGRAIKEMPATPIKKSESKQSLATISSSEDSGYMDGEAPPLPEEVEEPPPPPPVDPELLFSGARRGDLSRVLEYKEKGGDMDVRDKYGYTALHMATLKAHHRVVEFLCQLGVDINATDKSGWTCLHRACSRGYLYIVHELVKGKADINLRDGDGFTALQRAASKGHMDIVDLLLSHGADVNSADKLGWTALHGAASGGHADMVKKLLSLGADVQARDVVGKSPTSLAYDENVAKRLTDAKKWL